MASHNQQQRPIDSYSVPLGSRINIDALFGDLFNNMVKEPYSPYRNALFILLKLLDSCAQKRYLSENRDLRAKAKINALVYGLTKSDDLTINDLRRVVRQFDSFIPAFLAKFDDCLQIYGGTVESMVTISPFISKDGRLHYLRGRCYLRMILDKFVAAHQQRTLDEVFDDQRRFAVYVREVDKQWPGARRALPEADAWTDDSFMRAKLPNVIRTSISARKWIDRQVHLLQVSPKEAESFDLLLEYIGKIKQAHPDQIVVHLLEAIVHLRLRDVVSASRSLLLFCDLSSLKCNDITVNKKSHKMMRMAALDGSPPRFGSLMQARLHRYFQNEEMAIAHLFECVHLSQMVKDDACLRAAILERRAVELLRPYDKQLSSPPDLTAAQANLSDVDEHVFKKEADMRPYDLTHNPVEHIREGEASLVKDKILDSIHRIQRVDCPNKEGVSELSVVGKFCAHHQADPYGKTRTVLEAAQATAISLRLLHGSFEQCLLMPCSAEVLSSRRQVPDDKFLDVGDEYQYRNHQSESVLEKLVVVSCVAFLDSNCGDKYASRHDTEPHAIIAVNLIYALCALGRWQAVRSTIAQMRARFGQDKNYECWRHVTICESVAACDRSILDMRLEHVKGYIDNLRRHNPIEGAIRQGLWEAVSGQIDNALTTYQKILDTLKDQWSHLIRIRVNMAVGVLHIRRGNWSFARSHLEDALREAIAANIACMRAMVKRRIALVEIEEGFLETAECVLSEINDVVLEKCSKVEISLYRATQLRLAIKRDSISSLPGRIAAWKIASVLACVPLWTKEALTVGAAHFAKIGRNDYAGRCAAEFAALDKKFPGRLDWILF